MPPDVAPAVAAPPPRRPPYLPWAAVSVLGVLLLCVLAVHLPEAIKVPVLFPIGVGLLAGWAVGRWSAIQAIPATRLVVVIVFAAVAGGELLATAKSYRDWVAYRIDPKWQRSTGNPFADMAREALGDDIREARLKHLTFTRFLEDRVRRRGANWPVPWPTILWGVEILAASGLGAWLALKTVRASPEVPGQDGNETGTSGAESQADRNA